MPKAKEKKKEEAKQPESKKSKPKSTKKKDKIELKTFKIYGSFQYSDGIQEFIKEIKAGKETQAVDKTYKLIGSQHHVKRRNIDIKKIEVA